MSNLNFYVIDTSSLIDLNKRYPIDVFPSLWQKVEALIAKGHLISCREVLKEISVKDDALKKWAVKQKRLFRELDAEQGKIVKEILLKHPSLAQSENEVAAADPFLIALAIVLSKDPQKTLGSDTKSHIIVTEEKLRGSRVKIPFVCQGYGIQCIPIIEMFRIEGWQF